MYCIPESNECEKDAIGVPRQNNQPPHENAQNLVLATNQYRCARVNGYRNKLQAIGYAQIHHKLVCGVLHFFIGVDQIGTGDVQKMKNTPIQI